jgi:feruloyl esterase
LTAKIGQALVRAYYGRPASYTYFIGCSNGGRESLTNAQRYPEDFDGYLAGAPADLVNYNINHINIVRALRTLPEDQQLGPAQLKALSSKVLERCDALDGVKDGVLRDPRACKFDPGDMLCDAGENRASCLTPAQAKAIKQIYDAKDAKTESQIANGFSGTLGTEYVTWPNMLAGAESAIPRIATLFYGDPKFDPTTLDLAKVARDTAAVIAPIDPDLSRARSLGRKIIVFQGWADPDVSAHDSIAYFDTVTKRMGPNLGDFYRLFLVPGMPHCQGASGLGANNISIAGGLPPQLADADHDWTLALERWVEQGKAPDRMIATEFDSPAAAGPAAQMTGRIKSTRPVCVYPKRAVYKGSGPQSDAASFSCE